MRISVEAESDPAEQEVSQEQKPGTSPIFFKYELKKWQEGAGQPVESQVTNMTRSDLLVPEETTPEPQQAGEDKKGSVPVSAPPGPGSFLDKDDIKLSLSLRNIDVIEALKFFSIKTGLNVIPTQKVTGRVTLNVNHASARDIFDIMLRSNSLAYDKRGDIYNVMTEAEYKAMYGKNFFDARRVEVFHLKYAIPEKAFSLLDALKSEIGRLLVDAESGSVMLIDTPEKIAEARNALQALEQQNTVRVFSLNYAKAKDVEEQLKTQLDMKKVGVIKADDRTNQVIVQTLPERMRNIEKIIKSLDKKTKAVLIDVKIVKIKLTNQKDVGVEWEGLFNVAKAYGMTYLGSYPFSYMFSGLNSGSPTFQTRETAFRSAALADASVGSYPFSGNTANLNTSTARVMGDNMHIGIVDKRRDFDLVFKYLLTLGKSKIIASPSLSVIDNQEAKIHIGERRAYITTTVTTGTTTTTTSEAVTYVDIGVRLDVTPTISDDGYITLKIKPEISSVVGNVKSISGNDIPIIDTSTAETTVIAKDGSTIIIGGLGREEKTESTLAMPFFSSIPFIGNAFKWSTKSTEQVELVIMLTPIIFEGDKFISPKETEKFKIKPPKKFDVFRPEQPFTSQVPGMPLAFGKDGFSLKGTKTYDVRFVSKESVDTQGTSRNLVLTEDQLPGEALPKELKDYEKGGTDKEAALKGFKYYN